MAPNAPNTRCAASCALGKNRVCIDPIVVFGTKEALYEKRVPVAGLTVVVATAATIGSAVP